MDENNNNVNEVPNNGTTEPKAEPVTPKEETTQTGFTQAPEMQYQPTPPPNPQPNQTSNTSGGKGAGIASLILGIMSLVLAPWGLVAVLALILGIVGMILAIVQNKKNKTGVATGGLITSIFGMVISILVLIACVACTNLLGKATNSALEEVSYNYNSIWDDYSSYYNDDDDDDDDSYYNRYSSLANTIMQQATNTVSSQTNTTATNSTTSSTANGSYYVKGQTYTDEEWVITLTDVNLNYTNYSTYSAPSDGKKVVRATFDIQYLGSGSEYLTSTDFDFYADNYSCSSFYGAKDDDKFSSTLSTGKKAIGSVYFEVPVNATEITVEFETDWIHDEYVTFKLQ